MNLNEFLIEEGRLFIPNKYSIGKYFREKK